MFRSCGSAWSRGGCERWFKPMSCTGISHVCACAVCRNSCSGLALPRVLLHRNAASGKECPSSPQHCLPALGGFCGGTMVGSTPVVGLKPLGHPVTPLQEIIWSNVKGQKSRKRAGDIGRVLEVAVKGAGSDCCWIQDMSRAEATKAV